MKTIKNRIMAAILLLLGVISMAISGDGTFLLITLIFAISLIFCKENYII